MTHEIETLDAMRRISLAISFYILSKSVYLERHVYGTARDVILAAITAVLIFARHPSVWLLLKIKLIYNKYIVCLKCIHSFLSVFGT